MGGRREEHSFVGVTLVTRSSGGRLVVRFYLTCRNVLSGRSLYTANAANGRMTRTANLRVGGCLANVRNNTRRVNTTVSYGRVSLLLFFHSPVAHGSDRPGRESLLELYSIRGVPMTAGVTATSTLILTLREKSLS